MTNATWRVVRTDHYGRQLPPCDYDDKTTALQQIDALRHIDCQAHLQQYDPFSGEWTDWETT